MATEFLAMINHPHKIGGIDNRGSQFYLIYWAEALQHKIKNRLKSDFTPIATELLANEASINTELIAAQGQPQHINGHYQPNPELTSKAAASSATFNAL
jgi:isocitrate dehydrogenase